MSEAKPETPSEAPKPDQPAAPDAASKTRPPADSKPFLKRRPVRFFLAAVVLSAIGGTAYWLHARNWEDTDDAFIDTNVSPVAARVGGQVLEVKVDDNQFVKAGDVLAILDPRDLEADAAKARATAREAKSNAALTRANTAAKIASAKAGLASAKASVTAAEASLEGAKADLGAGKANATQRDADEQRYLTAGDRSVSPSQIDAAKATAAESRALVVSLEKRVASFASQLQVAKEKVGVAEADLAAAETAPEQIAVADAQSEQAAASLDTANLAFSYGKIIAPVSGRVTKRSVRVGQYLRPGQTLLAIVPQEFWVTANFKETQLEKMRPGQSVDITVDAYPDLRLKGRVDSIQAGSGASFSLLPPENATGNYVKVVQRVPVKIVFDSLDEKTRAVLGVGLSVVPDVHVSETPAAK